MKSVVPPVIEGAKPLICSSSNSGDSVQSQRSNIVLTQILGKRSLPETKRAKPILVQKSQKTDANQSVPSQPPVQQSGGRSAFQLTHNSNTVLTDQKMESQASGQSQPAPQQPVQAQRREPSRNQRHAVAVEPQSSQKESANLTTK